MTPSLQTQIAQIAEFDEQELRIALGKDTPKAQRSFGGVEVKNFLCKWFGHKMFLCGFGHNNFFSYTKWRCRRCEFREQIKDHPQAGSER